MRLLVPRPWALARRAAASLALLLALAPPVLAQTTGSVLGRVTSAGDAQPVVGAQVFLVGTGLGTLTGAEGRFNIPNVTPGTYTLRVERIGSRTSEQQVTVRAGEQTTVTVTLTIEALGLDEIVVTGTAGAARRREIGNSISQINLAQIEEPPINVDALLQARAPGLNVLQSSASAGGGAMIRLRGNVSVAMSNQPIIYVDGVRIRSDGFAKNVPPVGFQGRSNNDVASPLNDVNPNDIERIEVIKGAAATTLYGTEAAAGVIQIFTKRGHQGTAQWTFQIDQGFNRVLPFGPDPGTGPAAEEAITESGGAGEFMFINPWLRNAVPLLGNDCRDSGETGYPIFCEQVSHRQKYSLSVSGGSDVLRYFVSGTLEDNLGVLPLDEEKKRVVRGNFTFSPLRNLEFQWNTSFTNTDLQNTPSGNNAHGLTLNAYRRNRNYQSSETRRAIDPLLKYDIDSKINHLITGATLTFSPSPTFTHRLTGGWDLSNADFRNLRPFGFALAPNGIISDRRFEYQNLTLDYVGSFNYRIQEELRTNFSWGGQSIVTDTRETTAYGETFPGPGEPTVSSAGTRLGFEERLRVVNAGFFFQNVLDFRDRYFLTAGVRVDGNSAFGENLGLQAYPKASFSWVLSDESFWPEDLGSVKLRTAWGQSGRAPGAFDAVRTWDPVGWGTAPAFFPRNVGNPDIGPERTTEIEVGFDGAFFDQRVTTEFTWYRQNTTDALFNVRQVPSQGFLNSQLKNVGELENKGVELSVNVDAIRRDNFGVAIGGSLSTNFSKVVDLGEAPEFSLGSFGYVSEGQPVPGIRSRCVLNADEIAAPIVARPDSLCDFGPNLPTHIIGGNLSITLPKGILVTARGEYQGGHYMYVGPSFNAVSRSVRWPGCFDFYKLQAENRANEATARKRAQCTVSGVLSDFFVSPADFFKMRDLTVSVPIPTRWIPRSSSAKLTLSARNFYRWVNGDFGVFEPEMGANEGFDAQVRSIQEHVPPPATYTASIRVVF